MKILYESLTSSRFTRLEIDESILDTDKTSAENTENVLFFPYFAECFVKVFGKIDRNYANLDHRQGAPQRIGKIEVKDWKWKSADDNEFVTRLHKMIDMLKKKYPKMIWGIDHNMQYAAVNVWKVRYVVHFKFQEYEFNWCVDAIKEHDKITRLLVFYLHTRALKHKDLLKMIDDNI